MFTSSTALVISSIFGIIIIFQILTIVILKGLELFKRIQD